MRKRLFLLALLLPTTVFANENKSVRLDTLDLTLESQGEGVSQKNLSFGKNPLTIGGKKFEHGYGTHSYNNLVIELDGAPGTFSAFVGVDDESGGKGTVQFTVLGDHKVLFDSGAMKGRDVAKEVKVSLDGVKRLALVAQNVGRPNDLNHADWADAVFDVSGSAPLIHHRVLEPYILTPKAPETPRINGAKIFGVRPGNPFLFTIAATGARPMEFSAEGLPEGLTLDSATGRITGTIATAGTHQVTLHAKNSQGETTRDFKIVCGPTISLTPAMGWNSWNCWQISIDDGKVRATADAMVSSGLIDHGWTYVNIDDCWSTQPGSKDPTMLGEPRDKDGFINSNRRFPDMKALADYVHGKGLKIGIYSSPGPTTCDECTASYQHEEKDAQRWAEWGFDYLKYDWCSWATVKLADPKLSHMKWPYAFMHAALEKQHRDIVYSICQYGFGDVPKWGAAVGGNSWRTATDITDTWISLSAIAARQYGLERYAGPGHWNDPDMLIVGSLGWGRNSHPSCLTPDEQYLHISLWCLLSSPLLIGCDITRLDDFTTSLLSNDEVLAVNQDPLGKPAGRISDKDYTQVWARDVEDGSKVVGLFNLDDDAKDVTVDFSDLKISGEQTVRDLWRQKDVGTASDHYTAKVPSHGVVLIKIGK